MRICAEQVEVTPVKVEKTPPPAPTPEKAAEAPALPLDAFPMERCAAIAASMARRKADAARILEENGLTLATWEALDRHWINAIREENKRGKVTLPAGYDMAYVGRLEEERGPILVEEYARLVVAAERGNGAQVLLELGLPQGTLLRVQRIWLDKMIADPGFGAQVQAAVEVAREA